MAEHATLNDPLIHEPKGIQGLVGGTVDEDKVYFSDGAGGGNWRKPTSGISIPYIETEILAPAGVTVAVPAAVQNDLRLDTDYVPFINLFTVDSSINNEFTIDGITGEIVIPRDGVYYFNIWLNISEDFGNVLMAISGSRNGTIGADLKPVFMDKTRDANNVSNMSSGNIFTATAGDKLGLHAASQNAGDLTITDAVINIFMIQEL